MFTVATALTGSEILQEVIEILYGAISSGASALGAGVNALATNIFLTSDGSALSTVAILVAVFGGIAVTVGLGRRVLGWIMSLGK